MSDILYTITPDAAMLATCARYYRHDDLHSVWQVTEYVDDGEAWGAAIEINPTISIELRNGKAWSGQRELAPSSTMFQQVIMPALRRMRDAHFLAGTPRQMYSLRAPARNSWPPHIYCNTARGG